MERIVSFVDSQRPRREDAEAVEVAIMHVQFPPGYIPKLMFLYRTCGMIPFIDWKTDSRQSSELMGYFDNHDIILDSPNQYSEHVYNLFEAGLQACFSDSVNQGQVLLHGIAQYQVLQEIMVGLLPKMGRPQFKEWVQVDAETKKLKLTGHPESSLYRGLIQPPLGEPRLLLTIVSFLGEDL